MKRREEKRCGYPLCKHYHQEAKPLDCPTPFEGVPCQGLIEDTDEMEGHPEECRCEVCRFWS